MAVKNLFSQITDSRFYSGTAWHTWNVTDNISITNSSQSYTTEVSYSGPVDVTSTRYGAGGIEYYTYSTTTDGMVKASVHPYEYTTTTSQSITNVVKNTSVSNSYRVAVENSASFSVDVSHSWYYEVGRVADHVAETYTINTSGEKPAKATTNWWLEITVENFFEEASRNNTKTQLIPGSQINNTYVCNLYDGGVSLLPGAKEWRICSNVFYAITYSTYGAETASMSSNVVNLCRGFLIGDNLAYSSTGSTNGACVVPYLTYYSKSTSWNTLTTVELTYQVPAQTTTSWVSPKQLSSLVSQ